MAYKKYIKKNGKIYGPYIYHSKRVGGKVVSEYRGLKEGPKTKVNKKHFAFIFATIALVLFFTLFFTLKPGNLTGNVVLNLDSQYVENQSLEGVLGLQLNQGELIPKSSKVIFENAGDFYEYDLSGLIEDSTIEGDFFIQGQDSLGQGIGYGVIGKQIIYPDVYFQVKIISDSTTSVESSGETIPEEVVEEIVEEEPAEEIVEEPLVEEIIEEENITEEEIVVEPLVEEVVEETVEEIVEEEPAEEIVEEPVEETSESESSELSITGNVARGFFGTIANIFVGMSATGNVVESEDQIQVDISYGQEFRYTLKSGQRLEVVPDSIRTETKELSIENLQIFKEDNEVVIKTNYYEETFGFGKNYLGEEVETFNINISNLDLKFKDENLGIKLIYEEKQLLSFQIDLGESFIEELENVSLEESDVFSLTEVEKNILNREFGDQIVQQTARSYKGWIIVEFSLGDYEVEYSYNNELSKEDLDSLIAKDKLNWLKDISTELSTEETPSFRLEEFNKNYEIS